MRKFENKKSFKTPKKVWEAKRRGDNTELDDNERPTCDDQPYMVDGKEGRMEIGVDEGEIYIHDVDNNTWLWLTPDEAEDVGSILSAWAVELMS